MRITDKNGNALVKKSTKFLTNAPEVCKRINRSCSNRKESGGSLRTPLKRLQPKLVQHRHADVMGGYVKQCQLYPKSCCQAVCAGTEAPKKIHDLGMRSVLVMRVKEMIAAYVKSGVSTEENSPSKALHEDDSDCDDLSTCMAWVGTKASSRRTMYLAPS